VGAFGHSSTAHIEENMDKTHTAVNEDKVTFQRPLTGQASCMHSKGGLEHVMIFMNSLYLILSTRWPSINFSNIQVT
jgi:hypothetical protein